MALTRQRSRTKRYVFVAIATGFKRVLGYGAHDTIVTLQRTLVPGVAEDGTQGPGALSHGAIELSYGSSRVPAEGEFYQVVMEDIGTPEISLPYARTVPRLFRVTIDEIPWPETDAATGGS